MRERRFVTKLMFVSVRFCLTSAAKICYQPPFSGNKHRLRIGRVTNWQAAEVCICPDILSYCRHLDPRAASWSVIVKAPADEFQV